MVERLNTDRADAHRLGVEVGVDDFNDLLGGVALSAQNIFFQVREQVVVGGFAV